MATRTRGAAPAPRTDFTPTLMPVAIASGTAKED